MATQLGLDELRERLLVNQADKTNGKVTPAPDELYTNSKGEIIKGAPDDATRTTLSKIERDVFA